MPLDPETKQRLAFAPIWIVVGIVMIAFLACGSCLSFNGYYPSFKISCRQLNRHAKRPGENNSRIT